MTTDVFRAKKPFSPDDDLSEQLTAWQTLDLSAETDLKPGHTNALNLRRPDKQVAVLDISEPEPEFTPLTADAMAKLQQAAYDDGFAEGKEAGFSQGYQDGREQGTQDGLSQGIAEGKKQGLEAAQPEIANKLNQLAQLLDQLQQPLKGVTLQVEQALTELAIAMAQAIVAVEVRTHPQIVLQAVQDATSALPLTANNMLIKLHPDDINVIQAHFSDDELASRGWQLRAEPTLARGGCIVESDKSSVDRTLTQRLQNTLEHFLHQPSAE